MPEYVADEVIEQCDKILNADTEALVVTFEDKIDGLGLDDKVKDEYIETNKQYVDKYYLPSYEKVKMPSASLKQREPTMAVSVVSAMMERLFIKRYCGIKQVQT